MKLKIHYLPIVALIFLSAYRVKFINSNDQKIITHHYMGAILLWVSEEYYKDNLLLIKKYPFCIEKMSTELYYYNSNKKLQKVIYDPPNIFSLDSIVYNYYNDSTYSELKIGFDIYSERKYLLKGDTTFIDHIITKKYAFTSMEFLNKSINLKVSQIIKPELSDILNFTLYDKTGNEIMYIKVENNKQDTTMKFEYTFDENNRVINKSTYVEPGHKLMFTDKIEYK